MKRESLKKSIFRKFRSTQSTMMVSFSLLMVLAMLIFLFIALSHTKNVAFENSVEATSSITKQVNDNIDSYIESMENIAAVVANGSEVSAYLFSNEEAAEEEQLNKNRIVSQFETIKNSRDDISNIAAVGNNGKYIVNDGQDTLSDYVNIKNQRWYQTTLSSRSGQVISSSHVQNVIPSSYKWVITLSKALINNQTGKREGVFFVDLNYESISDLCNRNRIGSKGYVFILDELGNVVYHPKQQLMYGGLKTENIDQIMKSDASYIINESGDDSIIYTKSISAKTGWSVVGATYASDLLKNNTQTQLIYFLAMFLLLAGVLILSSFISREITKPIRELKDSMILVERGQFEQANVEVIANNELGSLTKSFNIMTERIQNLMEENVHEQKEKRKNELKALQAQINPHFLYNTLDSIIWMSEAKKNEEVVLMTSALARLFRQAISNDKEEVSIREEIEYVKNYLTIQKMRYKDKMDFEIQIDPRIEGIPIIKFAVQPLVENSIYHGLKVKDTKGNLQIIGGIEGGNAYIEIEDNGVGMEKETLEHIFDDQKKDYKRNGVGVNNVQRRLKLYYGEAYGISYESKVGIGTKARICVPIEREKRYE